MDTNYIAVPVWYRSDAEKITRSISIAPLTETDTGYRQRFDLHKTVMENIAYAFSMRPRDIASVQIHNESRRNIFTTLHPETIHELYKPNVTLEVTWKY